MVINLNIQITEGQIIEFQVYIVKTNSSLGIFIMLPIDIQVFYLK